VEERFAIRLTRLAWIFRRAKPLSEIDGGTTPIAM